MTNSRALQPNPISVIIPVIDDADYLQHLCERIRKLPHIGEIIVADGGSMDHLQRVVDSYQLTLLTSPPGRGVQMNVGARAAKGQILWFLHADTLPHERSTAEILKALEEPETIGGAFRFSLSEKRWYGPMFESIIGIRSSLLCLPYGDQGFFVRHPTFLEVGGFPEIPIMEDVEILKRLKKKGNFRLIELPIGISPRRWDHEGVLRRTLLNWFLMLRHGCGARPEDLISHYPKNKPVRDRNSN